MKVQKINFAMPIKQQQQQQIMPKQISFGHQRNSFDRFESDEVPVAQHLTAAAELYADDSSFDERFADDHFAAEASV